MLLLSWDCYHQRTLPHPPCDTAHYSI
jgi:hypothetical protein